MGQSTVAGAILIVSSAALMGALSGWKAGPLNVAMSQSQLSILFASLAGSTAVLGCGFFLERSAARARSHAAFLRLKRTLIERIEEQPDGTSHLRKVRLDGMDDSARGEISKPVGGRSGSPTCC